jgi:predicted O-methyltransferase YrrM
VTADALEVLGTLSTFNPKFADATPIKYVHIESVFRTLRPGGLLIVDDLEAGMRTSEVQHAEKDALQRSLFHHPELHAVEIE